MRIKKIHLKDYKRFHDLTIDLGDAPARIVALVGPNGCGKSSVFDGMLYLNNAYNRIGGGSAYQRDFKYHSLLQNPAYGFENIILEFDVGMYNIIRDKRQQEGISNTIFSFRSSFRYNGLLDVRELRAVSDFRENNYGATTASDIDTRIEESYRRIKIYYDRYLEEKDIKPSDAKRHIIGELNTSIKSCLDLEIESLGDIGAGRGMLFFKKKDTETPFSYNVLSAGEKEVVDLLLDLYLRKDEYKDSIYIIDEPELHLNTSIQKKLLIEINRLVPEKSQIWVATHSIGFLRALQEELNIESQIIEFTPENKWAKESYILKPMIKSRKAWQKLFATALDDLTSLVAPRTIVYCEGRDMPTRDGRERGLDADVYNNIFGNNYPETLFVSSGGNTELDQRSDIAIAVLSKALPDTKILVLKDRDMASGKETTEADRQRYLTNNPDYHRVLRRYEIENYLYDKDVLKAYCEAMGSTFDEKAYDDFVTDIINQNLKDETGRIKSICGITVSVNPDTFKRNLSKHIISTMPVYQELEQEIFGRR